jgi:LPS-assembly protein
MIGGRRFFLASFIFFSFLLLLSPIAISQVGPAIKIEASREPVRLRAEHISYDKAEDSYVAEGNVEIWQGDRKLTANRVWVNARTNEAEATGNVVLVQGEDVLRSEKMQIDLDTSLGIILQGTLFLKKQNFYLRGEEIERVGEDTYRILGGSFTTCNGDWPAWRFTGREALVTLEEYASVRGATFEVKNVPLLYSPYLFFPVKTQRQSGFLMPRVTYSNTAGVELNNAYFWAISKNMDATFYLDLATEKGIGEGLEYRYVRKEGSAGTFYGYHVQESDHFRQQRTDQLDRGSDRWLAQLQHEEYFSNTFFAKMRLLRFSDRQYFTDYGVTYADQASEQAYSFISLTKNWDSFSLYGEGRYTVDLTREDKTTLQYLPVVNFVGVRQRMFESPFYYSFSSSYGNFWREEGVTGQVLDLYPRLTLPLKWGDLEITPDFGARETLYLSQIGGQQYHSRELWDFTTTLATNFYRVFDTGWSAVPKIKHLLRPEITYNYIPNVDQSQLPNFGTPVASTNILPYSQVPNFGMPVPKANAVTYALTQRLIAKVSEGPEKSRYHEYVYLKLSQAYDLYEANRQISSPGDVRRPFGSITGEIRVKSQKYVSVENITTYDPSQNQFQTTYTSAGIADPRGDGLSLEHLWQYGTQEQINGSLRVKILSSLYASYGTRYSLFDRQMLETAYGLNYRHQCWGVDLTYSERAAVSGQPAERKIMFLINLLGVTSVGQR